MPNPPLALITGATAGIGEAVARRLAADGWQLVLVARRRERLEALAAELSGGSTGPGAEHRAVDVDVTSDAAPARIARVVGEAGGGRLHLLVNNAGAAWRGTFAETGWENVERHMRLNFEAPLRLIEELLPLLRRTAAEPRPGEPRVSIVNVASTAGRVARPGSAAYSASKFALAGWSDGLQAEEARHGVHVGLVLPGFVATEGFPAHELRARLATRWLVSRPEVVAEAIVQAGPGGRAERYVPRGYWIPAALRLLLPAVVRRAVAGGAFTTATGIRPDGE